MRQPFSRRTEYAVRAVHALASGAGRRTRSQIAEEIGAPSTVVAQVLADLASAGVVRAIAGRGGGYELPPGGVSLARVVDAVDPPDPPRCVLEDRSCGDREPCALHHAVAAAREGFATALAADVAGASVVRRPEAAKTLAPGAGGWLD